MTSPLAEWERRGWLLRETPSPDSIQALLSRVEDDLETGLAADWPYDRLSWAFLAASRTAAVALLAAGYQLNSEDFDVTAIESLRETIGAEADVVSGILGFLPKARRRVDQADVSDRDADEMQTIALKLRDDVFAWLRDRHPHLLP